MSITHFYHCQAARQSGLVTVRLSPEQLTRLTNALFEAAGACESADGADDYDRAEALKQYELGKELEQIADDWRVKALDSVQRRV